MFVSNSAKTPSIWRNAVPAGVDVVLEDEQYGSLGTEFTGTLEPTQASYELPQEIIFEDEEIVIIEECV